MEHGPLTLWILIRIAEEDVVSLGIGRMFDATGYLREERIGIVGTTRPMVLVRCVTRLRATPLGGNRDAP